jgi:hypothetical protein
LIAAGAGAVLAGGVLGFGAGKAHADPLDNYAVTNAYAICSTLDSYPTFPGVMGVGQGIVQDTGWTYVQAGRVIGEAVYASCPRHLALLDRFAATYGGTRQGATV